MSSAPGGDPTVPTMRDQASALAREKATVRRMGGPDKVARQHSLGKRTARERVDLLFDPGSFTEQAILAHHQDSSPQMRGKVTPADGVVCGVGRIDGRPARVVAYDFTVMAGSMGAVGEFIKAARTRQMALRHRMPIVWLIDSAGARIQETVGSQFARTGDLFREQVIMSGVIPQVAAMMGPGAAGTAYIPGLADFVPMVKGTSSMALGGPHLVKAAVGEDVTEQEMGGSQVHCKVSGVADLEVPDDAACIRAVRTYLSFFPSSNQEQPPVIATSDPLARRCERAARLAAGSPAAFDMPALIGEIVDGGDFFPLKSDWARSMITGLARVGGRPIGVVATEPRVRGGAIDVDAADKAARFVWLCDAFGIPLLFLVNGTGFASGVAMERQGIIRHGAKLLFAVAEATVPTVTVVVGAADPAGLSALGGCARGDALLLAWPTARLLAWPTATPEQRVAAHPGPGAGALHAEPLLIDPAETRSIVGRALSGAHQVPGRPWRKHGVVPV